MQTEEPWDSFRQQFPVTKRFVYLNHAAVAPLPIRCVECMHQYIEELTLFGAARYPEVPMTMVARARALAAQLLHARTDQIFVVRSTTQGIGIAATGIPTQPGDNVVLAEKEFPANIRPWLPLRRKGVEVRFVSPRNGRLSMDEIARAVDHRTVAVSLSFVQFLSGFRLDLAKVGEICRMHDALFVVDAIQGAGVFPIDVEAMGIDFLSADSHKWLLGPEGVGFGFVSERAFDRIVPALEGWLSVKKPFDFFNLTQPLKATAARYEEGATNNAGIHGMVGSLELISGLGVPALGRRILGLTDFLVDGLRSRGWEILSPRDSEHEKSGIVLTSKPGVDISALATTLVPSGFVLSDRDGALRVAPHAYNTVDELERLLSALDSVD